MSYFYVQHNRRNSGRAVMAILRIELTKTSLTRPVPVCLSVVCQSVHFTPSLTSVNYNCFGYFKRLFPQDIVASVAVGPLIHLNH